MAPFVRRLEQVDHLLRDDPVEGFRLAVALLEPPPSDACEHARTLDRFATACRMFRDLARAEITFEEADGLCRCDVCRWDRQRRRVFLRTDQGALKAARHLAEEAMQIAPDRAKAGRCRLALAYAELMEGNDQDAAETARLAIRELDRLDLFYLDAAATTIGFAASRIEPPPKGLLLEAREDLREIRRRWPETIRYRSARGKIGIVIGRLGYKLGTVDACELRDTLTYVQRLHVELGLWRDAVEITAETAELCAEMRREDLVAMCLSKMLDLLPPSLPLHVALAVRDFRKSLEAVDRTEIVRAAAKLRAALSPRSVPVPAL